jgi:serine/threonine protein kinase
MTPVSEITGRLSKALSDRYRVERELGVGGMATVFLAHDLKHERDVALKVLHPELAAVLGAERFLAEIKVTAKLQHPHIKPLLDSGEADGLLSSRWTMRCASRRKWDPRSTTRTGTA